MTVLYRSTFRIKPKMCLFQFLHLLFFQCTQLYKNVSLNILLNVFTLHLLQSTALVFSRTIEALFAN